MAYGKLWVGRPGLSSGALKNFNAVGHQTCGDIVDDTSVGLEGHKVRVWDESSIPADVKYMNKTQVAVSKEHDEPDNETWY